MYMRLAISIQYMTFSSCPNVLNYAILHIHIQQACFISYLIILDQADDYEMWVKFYPNFFTY